MDSDSSSFFETTYSQDERISKELDEEREILKQEKEASEASRKKCFEDFVDEPTDLFELPGLIFLHFNYKRIKFSFKPCDVVNFVSKKITFYCSLRYVEKYWLIRRNSFPVNFKWRIYKLFYDGNYFAVTDSNLIEVLFKIYHELVIWSREEEEYKKEKYKRYLDQKDMVLDSEDEELFLTDEEREALPQKRERIWRRMLPPKQPPEYFRTHLQPRRQKRQPKRLSP